MTYIIMYESFLRETYWLTRSLFIGESKDFRRLDTKMDEDFWEIPKGSYRLKRARAKPIVA